MQTLTIKDSEKIRDMLSNGIKVEVEWRPLLFKRTRTDRVWYVKYDGVVVINNKECILPDIDNFEEIRVFKKRKNCKIGI